MTPCLPPLDLQIKNGHVVLPDGITTTDVFISQGRIIGLGRCPDGYGPVAETLDATGLHVCPGIMDTHTHFREPGFTHKEDIESGTRGAVLGGITTVFEMPNTWPLTTTSDALAAKVAASVGRSWSNIAFFAGAMPDNIDTLAWLEQQPGCCGIKLFMGCSTGGMLVGDDPTIKRVLQAGHRRVAVHAEDEPLLHARRPIAEAGCSYGPDVLAHEQWRNAEVAFRATKRLTALAWQTGRPAHILHMTTAEEAAFLANHKPLVTCEVTPQHLTLHGPEVYERLGTLAQMNPPLRERHHVDALWQAVQAGVVETIGSDHAPHTLAEKAQPYPKSPSGMPGVQTLLPVMLTHVNEGRLSLEQLVRLTSTNPARLYGIAHKGQIAPGFDADLTLIDLKAKHTITHTAMANRSGWTPFDGFQATGQPVATIVGGRIAMRDNELAPYPTGTVVQFSPSFASIL
ncbi:MAG: dihydroorotase [Cyanobacteria bacterium HKST-UBA04]|nr:dihydroorotase [Cyanobacteria bacterium HKST-UBA04]